MKRIKRHKLNSLKSDIFTMNLKRRISTLEGAPDSNVTGRLKNKKEIQKGQIIALTNLCDINIPRR